MAANKLVYFDTGTTNSRIYLIENNSLVDKARECIGSRDVAMTGDNKILISNLKKMYDKILLQNKLVCGDIEEIYASGMATSPFGIKEVPHLTTPASIRDLHENLYLYFEPEFFKREIKLIRGLKTISDYKEINNNNLPYVNNVRGEEIESFGVISDYRHLTEDGAYLFLPGSHTHIIELKCGKITDILSTFSGELFQAIKESTILAKSLNSDIKNFDLDMIDKGFEILINYGFNRSLYLINTMQIFTNMSIRKKTSFFQGILVGDIIRLFSQKWPDAKNIIIAGSSKFGSVYKHLLETFYSDEKILILSKQDLAFRGFQDMIKKYR